MQLKILILGSTGLVGNAMAKHFMNTSYNVSITHRNSVVKLNEESIYYDPLDNIKIQGKFDYVINCIGILKPNVGNNISHTIFINALYPHLLANWCEENQARLIHISSDCVYTGHKGQYVETDVHDALDIYAKTKSLGESSKAMTIRTSVIGEEIHNHSSLIDWTKSMAGKQVNGYTNHYWNGITTKQYAKVCEQIISEGMFDPGIHHVFSTTLNKYEMLREFNDKWNLSLDIQQFETEKLVDRSLSTIKKLNAELNIPTFKEMLANI